MPANFGTKIDPAKVKMHAIKNWIEQEISRLMEGEEDEIVVEMFLNYMDEPVLKPQVMLLNACGFMTKTLAVPFMTELWDLLIEAQANKTGFPQRVGCF